MGMTMMMMNGDDDDEGWECKRLPVHALRPGYVVSQSSWGPNIAVGPAGPPREPSPIFRGEVRLNYEELSLSVACFGLMSDCH